MPLVKPVREHLVVAILSIATLTLTACGAGSVGALGEPEFRVMYVAPADGSVLPAQPSSIRVVLTRPFDPASVHIRSVRLIAPSGHELRGKRSVRSLTPTTIMFEPQETLELGLTYFVVVTQELLDVNGEQLRETYSSALTVHAPRGSVPTPAGPSGGSIPNFCPPGDGRTLYTAVPLAAAAIDTENGQAGDPIRIGMPSHRLHGLTCRRWILHWDTADGITTPSGEKATSISAWSDAGERVRLTLPDRNRTVASGEFPLRWAKDDSFFSFVSIDFDSGQPVSWIVRIPIRWENGKPVAQTEQEERFVRSSVNGPRDSEIHLFDWSPSGNLVVYEGPVNHLYLYNVESDTKTYLGLGDYPRFSPAGSDITARIAFGLNTSAIESARGAYTMAADGSQLTQVTPPLHPATYYWEEPVWSPDGTRLAVKRRKRISGPAWNHIVTGLEIVDLAQGTHAELKQGSFGLMLGWR